MLCRRIARAQEQAELATVGEQIAGAGQDWEEETLSSEEEGLVFFDGGHDLHVWIGRAVLRCAVLSRAVPCYAVLCLASACCSICLLICLHCVNDMMLTILCHELLVLQLLPDFDVTT